jgi:hypothetical protein
MLLASIQQRPGQSFLNITQYISVCKQHLGRDLVVFPPLPTLSLERKDMAIETTLKRLGRPNQRW